MEMVRGKMAFRSFLERFLFAGNMINLKYVQKMIIEVKLISFHGTVSRDFLLKTLLGPHLNRLLKQFC